VRKTKNIILGAIGILITMYTLFICINIFSIIVESNKLEKRVSRALENVLETYDKNADVVEAKAQLKDDICMNDRDENIVIDIAEFDLEKGIISVDVRKKIKLVTGKAKVLSCEKTALIDKWVVRHPSVTVAFYVGESLYKQYQLTKGEVCPMPKDPEGGFVGWLAADTSNQEFIGQIGEVWENQMYYAVIK